jgi:hypothetical protein
MLFVYEAGQTPTTKATAMPNENDAVTEPATPDTSAPTAPPEKAPATQPTAKKPKPKKVAAKKRSVKKPAAKPVQAKPPKKKPTAKKSAAKKSAPKKVAAKKPVAKKQAAKKVRRKKPKSKPQAPVIKAQAIRDQIKKLGKKVRGRDIIAALAAKGIKVTPAQVSTTLKAAGFRRARRRKTSKATVPTKAATANSREITFAVGHLVQTKKLADQLGGIARLKEALTALERLR